MKKSTKILIGVGIAILMLGLPLIGSYNGLINEESNVDVAYADIDSKLQRRNDLIPNLVNSVKGVMAQEKDVFIAIADARSKLAGAKTQDDKLEANNEMSSAVSRLLVVQENYPELKSNTNMMALMDELAGTENRISVERGKYNKAVKTFNVKVKRFPTSLMAKSLGFEPRPYFEAEKGAEIAPDVSFD